MLSLQNIRYALGQSNVKYSGKLNRKISPMIKSIDSFAKNNDVFVKILDKKDSVYVQVDKSITKHVADIPSYAMKNQTGDSVYIPIRESAGKSLQMKDLDTHNFWITLKNLRNQVNESLNKIAN